jgi:hypothetical protein
MCSWPELLDLEVKNRSFFSGFDLSDLVADGGQRKTKDKPQLCQIL